MHVDDHRTSVANSWRTANFTGAAVHGSLKDLSEYIGSAAKIAPKISFEEFDRKLAEAKVKGGQF